MRLLYPCALGACLISALASAGQVSEKTDRFRGTKTVSWESYRDAARGYSYNVYAYYAKSGDSAPSNYYAILVPPRDAESFSSCNHNAWLIDGQPAPAMEATYEPSGATQMFRAVVSRETLQKLSSAENVEFKICNAEGSISEADLAGIKSLLDSTK